MKRSLVLVLVVLTLLAVMALSPAAAVSGDVHYITKVLARGASIHGANGITIDAAGRAYIASALGREIVVLDTRTGQILDRYGVDDGTNGGDDVALGPDGSLYWTDILEGYVWRMAPDGAMTSQWVAPWVNPITFTDDGRLFVGQAFFGDGLFELDPDFASPPELVWHGSGLPGFPEQLNGFDFGPDGWLCAPQPFLGRIVRINVATGELEVIASGLDWPCAVKFDAHGELYAVVQGSGEVIRVDTATGTTSVFVRLVEGLDNLAFDTRGRLHVTHGGNGSVWRILPSGVARRLVRSGMVLPGGIAAMPAPRCRESLYVADLWEMKQFDARTGRCLGVTRQAFSRPSIIEPITVAPCGGDLVLTSWFGNAVQVWDPETASEVAHWDDFLVPMNAISVGGDLIVAELGTHSVVRQRSDGTRSYLAGPLYVPTGLAAAGGDVWAADWYTGLVYQLVDDGVDLAAPLVVASGLVLPEGMAVAKDGALLVVESGAGRVTRIDPVTGTTSEVASGLALGAPASPSMVPTWGFNGITVGARGDIYVTGDVGNVIYRIRAVPVE